MSSKPNRSILILISLLLAGCNANVAIEDTATAIPVIITATLHPTTTVQPSETPLPPPPQPAIAPVEGTTSTQLNVRAEPSTASEVIGIIPANRNVQIVGKDIGESWWQIVYEAGVDGKGWVTAQYVQAADSSNVPVIGGGGTNQLAGNSAVVIQQLNIRSGPGTNFNSLGVLNANDVVILTGKNRDGTWFQVDFLEGPGGKGWVNSGFVKSENLDNLPIVSDAGDVVGTGTPINTPPPPTLTLVPARMDFDSADAPIKTVNLEDAGTHTVLYNGDVSAPAGDREDWIQITSFSDHILLEVSCTGSDPTITLVKSGQALDQSSDVQCGAQRIVTIMPATPVYIHVSALLDVSQNYSSYILKVSIIP